jgi:two-component system CheB/CheR fusion protein
MWPAIVGVVYFLAALVGLELAFAPGVSAVWPPTGIAIAAVLLLGPRVWPGIAAGAFLANYLVVHEPVWTAGAVAAGNTAEALVALWLVRVFRVQKTLAGVRDARLFVLLAAGVSTTVSATVGVTSLCLAGLHSWSASPSLWWVWWVGDALGALVVAPLFLAWAAPILPFTRRQYLEVIVLLAWLVAVATIVFVAPLGFGLERYPLHYVIFPFVIRGARRLRQPGTTAVAFVASGVAIWGTLSGSGPFAVGYVDENLIALQLFTGVVAVTGLLLGAAITERDAAEALAADELLHVGMSEERLRLALDAGRLGAWDWNIATGDVKWSDNLETIHGLTPGSFAGTFEAFLALVHPEDRALVGEAIRRAAEDGTGYDLEFRTRASDGSVQWIAAKGRVFEAGGRAARMIGTAMNVTDRRRLEEELRARAGQLADADRRKDEFLGMLAHELRNPLGSLATALHLLRKGARDSERVLDLADRQVKQLARLVDDLLDVSRITEGKITLRQEPVVLDEVIARASELVRGRIEARRQTFRVSLPAPPLHLDVDPARLAQVIANLLANATEYTPPGGTVAVEGECVGDEVVIRVRDTGAGIAPELLPHVFDLFVQGDVALDRARGGLGLGLTIVRRLVELHGGHVEAHSEGPGRGAEFVVRLPAALRPPPAKVEIRAPARVQRVETPLKILLVEDNPDGAEGTAAVLRLWGHEVEVAVDARTALEIVRRFRPDVVLSDLGLPGMDGYELGRRLRSNGPGAPILVALSGYGRAEDRDRSRAAGFDHHFVKPPDLAALERLLAEIADDRVASAAAGD